MRVRLPAEHHTHGLVPVGWVHWLAESGRPLRWLLQLTREGAGLGPRLGDVARVPLPQALTGPPAANVISGREGFPAGGLFAAIARSPAPRVTAATSARRGRCSCLAGIRSPCNRRGGSAGTRRARVRHCPASSWQAFASLRDEPTARQRLPGPGLSRGVGAAALVPRRRPGAVRAAGGHP